MTRVTLQDFSVCNALKMRSVLSYLLALLLGFALIHLCTVVRVSGTSALAPDAIVHQRGRTSSSSSSSTASSSSSSSTTTTTTTTSSSAATTHATTSARLLLVTATQPAPCTVLHGDHVIALSLKNKASYVAMHGYSLWPSTELVSPWDLGGQWNKVALLLLLTDPSADGAGPRAGGLPVQEGQWLLWMDDDAIVATMDFVFPFASYEAQAVDLVLWGDEQMTYTQGRSDGINTGALLLRNTAWARALLTAWADVASSSLRATLTNHDQGGLVHLLHTQPERWRRRTRLERDITMNGHWPSYAGLFVSGQRALREPVWGSARPPFILHFSGCQMCRGHSYNGTWTEAGTDKCRAAFFEAFTHADDSVLASLALRHTKLGSSSVEPLDGSTMRARWLRLTRCMPRFLVVGTQKGGTSTLAYVLKAGWHRGIEMNGGEKEVHYFSFADVFAKGPIGYQQRWDGQDAVLGECGAAGTTHPRVRGEVSATYLDYPHAAERAAALIPAGRIVVLLREPVARLVSSFNMRWQIRVCGKLTWSRRDCYKGVTSREVIRENAVGPWQRRQAMKVFTKCGDAALGLRLGCAREDFVALLRNLTRAEMRKIDACAAELQARPAAEPARGAAPDALPPHRSARDPEPLDRLPFEPLGPCLGLSTLPQKKLYKQMEDNSYLYRSLYAEHLRAWMRHYQPSQLLVLASESLFTRQGLEAGMARLARFVGLPAEGPQVVPSVLTSASPASTGASPHENGRDYVISAAELPADFTAPIRRWLCPYNERLKDLLLSSGLVQADAEMPWLAEALAACANRP